MNRKAYQKPTLALLDITLEGPMASSIPVDKGENVDTSDKSRAGVYDSSNWEDGE